ncbi:MAG TPA: hypothetical protein VFK26_00020 [Gemmatimonadaceae bacterium]|nr:hypothetical protein [Gemmatimonadaceae bacterium]
MRHRAGIITLGLAIALPLSTAFGQQPAATTSAAPPAGPAVNDLAPDFTLTGADKYGLLKTPVRLSDFRGRTVVLAFFFQARTKG